MMLTFQNSNITICEYFLAQYNKELDDSFIDNITLDELYEFIRDIRKNYKSFGSAQMAKNSYQVCLGYSFTSLGRNVQEIDNIFSYHPQLFLKKEKFFDAIFLLLSYFPQIFLPLEMDDPLKSPLNKNANSNYSIDAFKAFLYLIKELELLNNQKIFQLFPSHFFHDGSRIYLEKAPNLSIFSLCKRNQIDEHIYAFEPDVRADIGQCLNLKSDYLTDSEYFFNNAYNTFKLLDADCKEYTKMKTGFFTIKLDPIKLPLFINESMDELLLFRKRTEIISFFNIWTDLCRNCSDLKFDHPDFINQVMIKANKICNDISQDICKLSSEKNIKADDQNYIRLTFALVIIIKPDSFIPFMPLPQYFEIANASEMLHDFSSWFWRAFGENNKGTISKVLTLFEIE